MGLASRFLWLSNRNMPAVGLRESDGVTAADWRGVRDSPAARQSLRADMITVPRIMETMNLRNGLSARINDFNCYHILRMATYFQPKPLFRMGRSSLLRKTVCGVASCRLHLMQIAFGTMQARW